MTDSKDSKHIVIDARIRRGPGMGRYIDRLLEHLQANHSPHRFTVLVQPDDPWRPRAANFTTVAAPYPQFSFNFIKGLRFAFQLNKLKPDLVHFAAPQHPLAYRGNMIITTHDLTMLHFVRAGKTPLPIFWLKRLGYRIILYVAHKKARRVIVPTKYVARHLGDYYPFAADKTIVTYEASDPLAPGDAVQPKGIKSPFLLHVGSPFPHKNIHRLIEAFEILLKDNPTLKLVLVGKKEFYFKELEDWASKRPSYKSVIFTGFVEDPELKWLYANAEAYVMPSLSEGFGLPGLEAMIHDCPLVSSNATCLPEVFGEAAVYFDPLSVPEMAKAIQSVLSDEKLRQKLIHAGHLQDQKYSWRKMAEQTLRIYDDALASPRS
jgi:glycosyltransferase involved in cell wall biosynthesis